MFNFLKKYKLEIALFALAFICGFFWNHRFYFKPIADIYSDQHTYYEISQNVINGNGFLYKNKPTNIEPGYPLFLAALLKLSGNNLDFVRFFQLGLISLTCVLIYLLAKKIFDKKTALLAATFSSFFWVFANYAGFLLRESLLVFLLTLFIYLLYQSIESKKYTSFLFAGITGGLFAITNGILKYFLIFVLLGLFFILKDKLKLKEIALKASVFLIAFIIIIIPWEIRNYNLDDKLESKQGQILNIRTHLMEKVYPDIPKYYFGHLTGYFFFEKLWPEKDAWAFRDIYVKEKKENPAEFILKNPFKYTLMVGLDFLNFNSPLIPNKIFGGNGYLLLAFTEKMDMEAPDAIKALIIIFSRLYWYFFLFLVVYSIGYNIKKIDKLIWLLLICLFFNLIYSMIHALPRYAIQIYPFYIILAANGFLILINKFKKNEIQHPDTNIQ